MPTFPLDTTVEQIEIEAVGRIVFVFNGKLYMINELPERKNMCRQKQIETKAYSNMFNFGGFCPVVIKVAKGTLKDALESAFNVRVVDAIYRLRLDLADEDATPRIRELQYEIARSYGAKVTPEGIVQEHAPHRDKVSALVDMLISQFSTGVCP